MPPLSRPRAPPISSPPLADDERTEPEDLLNRDAVVDTLCDRPGSEFRLTVIVTCALSHLDLTCRLQPSGTIMSRSVWAGVCAAAFFCALSFNAHAQVSSVEADHQQYIHDQAERDYN